jgi:hypothetical protein
MSIALAQARLRGIYAIVAGAILIVVVPFFEGTILASTGYATAVMIIINQYDFGPYLAWVGANQDLDVIFHGVQFLVFLLAFTLPPVLVTILWTTPSRASLLARLCGQIGFGCYALAIVLGLLVTGSSAADYANAATAAQHAAVADHFGSLFALQNVLSHIAGGAFLAASLMIFSAQTMHKDQKMLPAWLGYLGVLVAALLVITALQFAAVPAAAETSLSSVSFFALAVWLVLLGVYLARIRALPGTTVGAGGASLSESTRDSGAGDPNPQSDGQSMPEETTR